MIDFIDAAAVTRFHREALAAPVAARAALPASALWKGIADNHRCNTQLWQEEDLARRVNVDDAAIATNKRAIDRFNQLRNDAVERIDDLLLKDMPPPPVNGWLNSESAGSIIDRLSILSLKIHHMARAAANAAAPGYLRRSCELKLRQLELQRVDLQRCLDRLLSGLRHGRCYFKVYRQYKMYNDPALNPYLRRSGPAQLH